MEFDSYLVETYKKKLIEGGELLFDRYVLLNQTNFQGLDYPFTDPVFVFGFFCFRLLSFIFSKLLGHNQSIILFEKNTVVNINF